MILIDTRVYPNGDTYNGAAFNEIIHYEFLKTYNETDAINNIYTAVEQTAINQGVQLLRVEVSYESGTLYHLFDINYYYKTPQMMSVVTYNTLPWALVELAPYIIAALIAIIGSILVFYTVLKPAAEIQYIPSGLSASSISPLGWGIILIGAGYMLTSLTGAVRATTAYKKESKKQPDID